MAALLCGWGSTLNAYQYSNHIFVSIGILKRIGHKRRRTKRKQKTHKKKDKPPGGRTYNRKAKFTYCLLRGKFGFFYYAENKVSNTTIGVGCRSPPSINRFELSKLIDRRKYSMNADNKKIWILGQPVNVTNEVYEVYVKGDRKIRYFEKDLKTESFVYTDRNTFRVIPSREDSLERLMIENSIQFADNSESVEDNIIRRDTYEILYRALAMLSKDEFYIIFALYFERKTERELASLLKLSQPAVHKKKCRILKKLKKYF